MRTAGMVATYNRPDALEAVLAGYAAKDTQEFELLIASGRVRAQIGLDQYA
ncbi:MAG: hypothetical protein V4637_03860 [Pseudomonadota bacterium]